MAFSVNEIRAQLQYGGARPSLFSVQITNPSNGAADLKLPFLCEGSSIPEAQIGTIEVPYFGRKIKVSGDRVYQPWPVVVINDEDFLIRNAMENWSRDINTFQGNIRAFSSSAPSQYKSQAIVTQYGQTGNILRVYEFIGLWPAAISPIQLEWGAVNQIEHFQVTFNYDYWIIGGGTTGTAGETSTSGG